MIGTPIYQATLLLSLYGLSYHLIWCARILRDCMLFSSFLLYLQIVNEADFPSPNPTASVSSFIQQISNLSHLQPLFLDLLSLLYYASNIRSLPSKLTTSITIILPLFRALAATPQQRYIESRAIQYSPSQSLPFHSEETISRQCDLLEQVGVVTPEKRTEMEQEMCDFQQFGGKILFHSPLKGDQHVPLAIRAEDCVLNICHEGCNRSQILCEGVAGVRRALASHPHLKPFNQV